MMWFVVGAVGLVLVGVAAWFYPFLKSRITAAWRANCFRALASELGAALSPDGASCDTGFMPTVWSVFGPYGELRNIITQRVDDETVYLFEYRFGGRPSRWAYRRGVTLVAIHLAKQVPMFTLQRPRGQPKSRKTSYEARGQRLVVQAIGDEIELWSLERDRKRARAIVGAPLLGELRRDPGWDIRGIDHWLVIFNEKRRPALRVHDLERFFEHAKHLGGLVDAKGRPR
ncbi:hypothetical protein ACFL6C_14410 [Myxococcota bacterium]